MAVVIACADTHTHTHTNHWYATTRHSGKGSHTVQQQYLPLLLSGYNCYRILVAERWWTVLESDTKDCSKSCRRNIKKNVLEGRVTQK
jgi:hypothetical protein